MICILNAALLAPFCVAIIVFHDAARIIDNITKYVDLQVKKLKTNKRGKGEN